MKRWREKDGRLIHDGDCYFWSIDICTCGLLHHLCQTDVYPDWYCEEQARHDIQISRVPQPKPYVPPTEEEREENERLLREIFGDWKNQ